MASSGDLLRMLEPAVRPVAAPASGVARSAATTFESQSFDQLLQAAQTGDDMNPSVTGTKPPTPDPLASLSRIDAVSNASLRHMLQTAD